MKQRSLFCAGPWPFICLPLLLTLPLLFFKWHVIEDDVARNVRADLNSIGADWAVVETKNRGRNVLITGTPPNEAAIAIAKEKAANSTGVNRVDVSSDVKPAPSLATLISLVSDNSILISGTAADQASIDSLISQAERAFGRGNVTSEINVESNTTAMRNLEGFFAGLKGKSSEKDPLKVSLIGNRVTLAGTVNSEEANASLLSQMKSAFGLKVSSSIVIEPAVFACQKLINHLLADNGIVFSSAKAIIQESSFELLGLIKSTAEKCPEEYFEVAGHTDSSGSVKFNMQLSQQRAQAVIDHLAGLGLNVSKFNSVGYGPTKPIAENATAAGRAQNRRIEFNLKN